MKFAIGHLRTPNFVSFEYFAFVFLIAYPLMIAIVVSFTKAAMQLLLVTAVYYTGAIGSFMPLISFFRRFEIMPINIRFFRMVFANMLSTGDYFHILYSIVCFITVYMVYLFSRFEWATKILFHKVAVVLNSFTVSCGSHIPVFCFSWFIPYRQGKALVTIPAMVMQGTEVFRRSVTPFAVTVWDRTQGNFIKHALMIPKRK